ncbi:MAG TPA: glycine zipper 2TM domain-containing protein [Solimonas sp.]|nr:glycine zipper 2TM domain-containing protein [Solimonas sp.]
MNNMAAGIAGGVATVVVAASALVFATRSEHGDDGKAETQHKVAATHTECSTERVVTRKEWGANTAAGTVIGGVAGGALGHQIGGGSGKDAATVAGAVGGAYIGNKVAKEKFPDQEVSYQERCREVPG